MSSAPDPAEATRRLLAGLWERNLPITRERVDELSAAASAAASGTLSSEQRESAHATAHKLAGSLGMFGYPQGTELAREIELALNSTTDGAAAQLLELTAALRELLAL